MSSSRASSQATRKTTIVEEMMRKQSGAMKTTGHLILLVLILALASCQVWGKLDNPTDPVSAVQAKLITGGSGPNNSIGANGDLYMDTAAATMYVKINGAWTLVANLKGDTGPEGATWLSGAGKPLATLGANGDLYLDTTAIDVYTKAGGAWTLTLNLRGPAGTAGASGATGATGATGGTGAAGATGATGASGSQGATGSQGAVGSTWYTGAAAPSSATGVDGDLYLATASTMIYKKTGNIWNSIVALQGPQGPQGPAGPTGPTGPQGPAGATSYEPPFMFIGQYGAVLKAGRGNDKIFVFNSSQVVELMSDLTWVRRVNDGYSTFPAGIEYGNGHYVRILGGSFLVSTDLSSWSAPVNMPDNFKAASLVFGNGLFVAVGSDLFPVNEGCTYTSSDGISWQGPQWPNRNNAFKKVRFINGQFIATGYGGVAYGGSYIVSTNGIDWSTPIKIPGTNGCLVDVAYGNNVYVFIAQGTSMITSTDLIAWSYSYVPGSFSEIAFGDGHFLAVGSGQMIYSGNGMDWKPYSWGSASFSSVLWANDRFLVTY